MRRDKVFTTAAMIFSGGVVALVPATVQAVVSRLWVTEEQAAVALALAAGAFLSVVVNGAILESGLADPGIAEKTYLPNWSIATGLVGGIALIISPARVPVVVLALPLVMTSLQLGRTYGSVESRWKPELAVGAVLLAGCLSSFVMALNDGSQSLRVVGLAVVTAVVLRSIGAKRTTSTRPSTSRMAWVGAETTIVASSPLILNVAVFAFVGPGEAVAFRLILTVLGILQPVLGYLRTMLLRAASTMLTMALSALSVAALGSVVMADQLGIFAALFGTAWTHVDLGALAAACVWKIVSIPTNIPFAAMRRRGDVSRVFLLRLLSTMIYVALGLVAAIGTERTDWVFVSFIVGELAAYALYASGSRISRPPRLPQLMK